MFNESIKLEDIIKIIYNVFIACLVFIGCFASVFDIHFVFR